MVRRPSQAPADNGWRIFSSVDTDEFLSRSDSMEIVDFNRVCAIEPILIGIWDLPVGMDLQVVDDGTMHIVETDTGREIPPEMWFVPPDRRDPSSP